VIVQNKTLSAIQRFDNLFDDAFIENATEEEIELRFNRMKKICEQDNLKLNEVIDELEFYCNSFIANVTGA